MADLAALADYFEMRSTAPHTKPVWEKKLTFFTAAGAHADVAIAIPLNGILQTIILFNPVSTAGTTATLTIDDNNNIEIFNSGAKAESDTVPYIYDVREPLAGTIDVTINLTADPTGAGHTATVYLRGI